MATTPPGNIVGVPKPATPTLCAPTGAQVVFQAYRFALDPTPAQEQALRSHAGAARFAYNWALNLIKANLDQRTAERSYGLESEQLTPAVPWKARDLRDRWNQIKDTTASWWAGNSKEAYTTGFTNLEAALSNWANSRSGKRKGPRVGFPRLKSRRRATLSMKFTTGAIRVEPDRRHVTLPRLGTLRTHESTRKLARRLAAGTARIRSVTVRFQGGRWHASFTCEIIRVLRAPLRPDAVIGVDLGLKHLAILSNGTMVNNPRPLRQALGKLGAAHRAMSRRQGPDRRTGQVASNRWLRAVDRQRKIHARVANLRRDGLHKLTSRLTRTFGTIVVEDLNVAGMLKNRRLARSIADAGWGELRRQLGYKTTWNGGRLEVADRFFPSSKTCSGCGVVKTKLHLSERTFHCTTCGMSLDRDLNAARNLAALVRSRPVR